MDVSNRTFSIYGAKVFPYEILLSTNGENRFYASAGRRLDQLKAPHTAAGDQARPQIALVLRSPLNNLVQSL